MNPYTTRGQFRIQPRDLDVIVTAHGFLAAPRIVALERLRGRQAEAEVARQLTDHGLTPNVPASAFTMVRQIIEVWRSFAPASTSRVSPPIGR